MTIETKLQIEALKILDRGVKAPCYAKDEDCFFLALNDTYVFHICNALFWLDPDDLEEVPSLTSYFKSSNILGTQELTVTNEMRKLDNAVGVLLKCDDFTTCINEKYIKMFWNNSCKLYAKDEKSMIYFVRNDKIYAAVMPISLKKIGGA